MIKVQKTKTSHSEGPCSIGHFLDAQLQESRLNIYAEPPSLEIGNFLPLLKLITEKLHAAKMVSDQELLDALGGGYEWNNLYFKTK
jgi:hypothetical protein